MSSQQRHLKQFSFEWPHILKINLQTQLAVQRERGTPDRAQQISYRGLVISLLMILHLIWRKDITLRLGCHHLTQDENTLTTQVGKNIWFINVLVLSVL